MTLEHLFLHASISRYSQGTWFTGALLKPPYLFVDMPQDAIGFIEKHYLPLFRELIADLEIRPLPKPATPAKAQTRYPSIKPGPWRDRLDGLDS